MCETAEKLYQDLLQGLNEGIAWARGELDLRAEVVPEVQPAEQDEQPSR